MHQTRDPAIKLFGHKIPFPDDEIPTVSGDHSDSTALMDVDKEEEEKGGGEKDPGAENAIEKEQEADPPSNAEGSKNSGKSLEARVNTKTPSIEEEGAKSESGKSEKEQSDAGTTQKKTLKKPDKVLPCPRCNSIDTKFCYYNNYNVNQPRYFCKACQRYWTSGGTMRNVPVGAGRRKNKNSASHYPHITVSEALQAARIDAPNGRVLNFELDAPICDSDMPSVMNLGDKKILNGTTRNEFHGFEDQRFPLPCESGENYGDDIGCSSASSIMVLSSTGECNKSTFQEPILGKDPDCLPSMQHAFSQSLKDAPVLGNNDFVPQVPCIPSVLWPYPWNSPIPSPALCPSGFSPSFFPAPFWNCTMPGNWNCSWFSSHSSPSNLKSTSSGPNSPTLGKHSRDGDLIKPDSLHKEEPSKQTKGCVLVPKTLRIDDPSEAAKSSIWETLGIKNESVSGVGMFNKAFKYTKKYEKNHGEASPMVRANPAALSRSLNFHENS